MAYRFAFFALLVLTAVSCSKSNEGDDISVEGDGDDISVEDGIKTIREYGSWALQSYVSDPIEETKEYFIMTHSNHYEAMELTVYCSGSIGIGIALDRKRHGQLLLNYRSSSESSLAYPLRAKWGSGTEKHIDKIWAHCERNTNCQFLSLFPYKNATYTNELLTTNFDKNRLVEVAPSLKEPMTTYDKLMLEVEVIQNGSEHLKHYTFDLDGFDEANDALLAKEGCKPIPPLTAILNFSLHTIGATSWRRAVEQ